MHKKSGTHIVTLPACPCQPEEYQKTRSIRICPAVLSKWDRKMQVRSGICSAVLSKWDRICEKMLCSSASQVQSGICPAMLSKWDRVCKRMLCSHLRHRCEVASVLQCFPNGIVSARTCYAHLRHRSVTRCRCEVASALQCFPNGIVSARTCYALLRRPQATTGDNATARPSIRERDLLQFTIRQRRSRPAATTGDHRRQRNRQTL